MNGVWKVIAIGAIGIVLGGVAEWVRSDEGVFHAKQEVQYEGLRDEIKGLSERLIRVEVMLENEMLAHHPIPARQ